MKIALYFAAVILTVASNAMPIEEAANEFASELAFCAGYYAMTTLASEKMGRNDEAARQRAFAEYAIGLSAKFSSQKKALASLELAIRSQKKVVQEEGNARLILIYSETCKVALEHPELRLQYWTKKK